jgi:hypothetical protein
MKPQSIYIYKLGYNTSNWLNIYSIYKFQSKYPDSVKLKLMENSGQMPILHQNWGGRLQGVVA